jgi:hypothetical protein
MACGCRKDNNTIRIPYPRAGIRIGYFTGQQIGARAFFAPGTIRYALGNNPESYFADVKIEHVDPLRAKYPKEILFHDGTIVAALITEPIFEQEWIERRVELITAGYRTLGELAAVSLDALIAVIGGDAEPVQIEVKKRLGID